jgi:hypothetical protein
MMECGKAWRVWGLVRGICWVFRSGFARIMRTRYGTRFRGVQGRMPIAFDEARLRGVGGRVSEARAHC